MKDWIQGNFMKYHKTSITSKQDRWHSGRKQSRCVMRPCCTGSYPQWQCASREATSSSPGLWPLQVEMETVQGQDQWAGVTSGLPHVHLFILRAHISSSLGGNGASQHTVRTPESFCLIQGHDGLWNWFPYLASSLPPGLGPVPSVLCLSKTFCESAKAHQLVP